MKRSHNEDNLCVVAEENLYMVADGMGGHAAGEVASQLAVDTIAEFFRETSRDEEITWPYKMEKGRRYEENRLSAGIKLANLRIHEMGTQNPEKKGMGTTVVAIFFSGNSAALMLGSTPPAAMMAFPKKELSSSSLRTAS